MKQLLRRWRHKPYSLTTYATSETDYRGQTRIAYSFRHQGEVVFQGADFCGSPLHADDSDATLGALLSFLSLRPGDTDPEYFASYSPAQLSFAREHGEYLSILALELEERDKSIP